MGGLPIGRRSTLGAMLKYMSGVDPSEIRTLDQLLETVNLQRIGPQLKQGGVTRLEELVLLTPSAMEEMGVTGGIRQRLLRAAEMMRQVLHEQLPQPDDEAMRQVVPMADIPGGRHDVTFEPRQQHNSTSSLYIDSTISNPDFTQIVFCVSLLVQDLIVEGEASHRAKLAAGVASVNPLQTLRPKEIFITGARGGGGGVRVAARPLAALRPTRRATASPSPPVLRLPSPPSCAPRAAQRPPPGHLGTWAPGRLARATPRVALPLSLSLPLPLPLSLPLLLPYGSQGRRHYSRRTLRRRCPVGRPVRPPPSVQSA